MFFLKLAGHVTKLSKNSYWLITFVLLSANNFIGWRVYSCLGNSFGCICFQPEDKGKLSLSHKQGNPLEGRILDTWSYPLSLPLSFENQISYLKTKVANLLNVLEQKRASE